MYGTPFSSQKIGTCAITWAVCRRRCAAAGVQGAVGWAQRSGAAAASLRHPRGEGSPQGSPLLPTRAGGRAPAERGLPAHVSSPRAAKGSQPTAVGCAVLREQGFDTEVRNSLLLATDH